jgi:hypothetical protein
MATEHLGATHDPFWFSEACRRAVVGMELLDQRGPAGWLGTINIPALDMGHPSRDVLGQLYGSYNRGMAALFGDDWDVRKPEADLATGLPYVAYGFAPALGMTRWVLTDAWKKELWANGPHRPA